MRDAALPGAGACLGYLLTGPLGGVAVLGGVFAGAAMGDMLQQNASLASGETLTDDMLKKQMEAWKTKAFIASVEAEDAKKDLSLAARAYDAFRSAVLRAAWAIVAVLLAWHHWKNRAHWAELGYWRGVWWRGVVGRKLPKSG